MAEVVNRPNFFIVGAPKCGTTAMYSYLQQHPDIFMPQRKEPHFFGTGTIRLPVDITDHNEYLQLFAGATTERRIGEATVWYLFSQTAAQDIHAFNPDAKIIIMLRNPVEMVYALYHQVLYAGGETIRPFEAALDAVEDRRQGQRIPIIARRWHTLCYTDIARFSEQVERYVTVFGRDQVHVIIFDDFKTDPAREFRRTLRFLDVDPDFEIPHQRVNPSKRVRFYPLHFAYSYLAKLGMLYLPRPAWHLFDRSVIRPLRALNSYQAPRPQMPDHVRDRLRAEFAPDVQRLSDLLERNLMHWVR